MYCSAHAGSNAGDGGLPVRGGWKRVSRKMGGGGGEEKGGGISSFSSSTSPSSNYFALI